MQSDHSDIKLVGKISSLQTGIMAKNTKTRPWLLYNFPPEESKTPNLIKYSLSSGVQLLAIMYTAFVSLSHNFNFCNVIITSQI